MLGVKNLITDFLLLSKSQKISISKFKMILNIRTGCQVWFKFIWEIFRYDVDPGTTSNSIQLPKGESISFRYQVWSFETESFQSYIDNRSSFRPELQ